MRMDSYRLVCWDFDGVIKESVELKGQAFCELFKPFGAGLMHRIVRHHEDNGGMSRFEKLPLYLAWAGQAVSAESVAEYSARFAKQVVKDVVAAPWVPGAEALLRDNPYNQIFVIVSATPKDELDMILAAIDLGRHVSAVFGAPTSKSEAIRTALGLANVARDQCLMIGDAQADLEAAQENAVAFLLRRHALNERTFAGYIGESLRDFTQL